MNNSPKISIVTPSFNQGKFIETTIKSVLNQNYNNFEYIIVDGGSTDNTLEILKRYNKQIHFWISEPDNGQSDAINKGFAKATGDIFYWINSDDYLLPEALNTIANFNWKPNIGAVVGIGNKVNLSNQIVYTPNFYEPINIESLINWTNNKNFMQPACFFTKTAWNECGPLNTDLHFCMDVDLWINISKKFEFKRIKQEFANAYIHDLAKTTADVEKMKIETFLMFSLHGEFLKSRKLLFNFFENEKRKFSTTTVEITFYEGVKLLVRKVIKRIKYFFK